MGASSWHGMSLSPRDHVCMHAHIFTCINAYIRTNIRIRIHTYICTYIHEWDHQVGLACLFLPGIMYACMHVCMYVQYVSLTTYTYIHKWIHAHMITYPFPYPVQEGLEIVDRIHTYMYAYMHTSRPTLSKRSLR